MNTIKKGSRGSDVVALQKALDIKPADGIFGNGTESSVKNFQKTHGLTEDGIVGPATWSVIMKQSDTALSITNKFISKNLNKRTSSIQYIVIHYTAGRSSNPGSAIKEYNTFMSGSTSADFAVDDENIIQFNPDISRYCCNAVGGGKGKYGITNSNSISIEMCSNLENGTNVNVANHSGWTFTEKTLERAAGLARFLMKKYNVPEKRVVRHYDASRKLCPGVIGWNNERIYDKVTGNPTSSFSNTLAWENWKKRLL